MCYNAGTPEYCEDTVIGSQKPWGGGGAGHYFHSTYFRASGPQNSGVQASVIV